MSPQPVDHRHQREQIRDAYIRRDSRGPSEVYRFTNPAYLFHFQDLEWEVLSELRREEMDLSRCRVLEVGAGIGRILHRLQEFGARQAVGIDLVEGRIEEGRRTYPTLELIAGDAAEMPFSDQTFDLVTQFTCLSSVTDASFRAAIAREMWRVLAPGGAILSYDMRPRPFYDRFAARKATPPPHAVTTVPISPEEIAGMFPKGEIRQRTVGMHFPLGRFAAVSRPAATLLRALPFLHPYALVTVRKRV